MREWMIPYYELMTRSEIPKVALKYWLLFLILLPAILGAGAPVVVGNFSAGTLDGWDEESFAGHTDYQLVTRDGRQVLQARSQAAASGLFRKVRIDLTRTPYLNWSWKIENTLKYDPGSAQGIPDERSKQGDDYPARIYVVFSGGLLFWKTKALNYVWSSSQQQGANWANAYTSNARMIAVQGGDESAGLWVSEQRNIREDFKLLFGKDVRYVDAVAVMTDTDNTGSEALAWYGDIYFSAD